MMYECGCRCILMEALHQRTFDTEVVCIKEVSTPHWSCGATGAKQVRPFPVFIYLKLVSFIAQTGDPCGATQPDTTDNNIISVYG